MLVRLLLLFTIVPMVELALLIWLAQRTSLELTLWLVLATGVVGAALARYQGLRCWGRIQREMAAGRLPGDPLLDGLMILVAGALLVTPGVLTDLVGFGLLLPILRRIIKRRVKERLLARIRMVSPLDSWPRPTGQPAEHDEIIDTRVIDTGVIDVPPEESKEP